MIRVDPPFGGFALAAQALEARYNKSFTRQQVYAWHRRAALNGFPDQVEVTGRDGRKRRLLDLARVIRWYATYHPNLGGRPLVASSPEELRRERAVERAFCQQCSADPGQSCRDGAGYPTATHDVRMAQIAVAGTK